MCYWNVLYRLGAAKQSWKLHRKMNKSSNKHFTVRSRHEVVGERSTVIWTHRNGRYFGTWTLCSMTPPSNGNAPTKPLKYAHFAHCKESEFGNANSTHKLAIPVQWTSFECALNWNGYEMQRMWIVSWWEAISACTCCSTHIRCVRMKIPCTSAFCNCFRFVCRFLLLLFFVLNYICCKFCATFAHTKYAQLMIAVCGSQ